jgi:hypothetical protein
MVLCYLQICKSFSCTLCALMGLLTWWLQWLHNFKLSSCINWALEFKEEQTTASSHLVSKPNSSYHHIPRTQANCLSSRGECWHPKRSGFCVRPNSKTQLSNWLFSNCTPSFTPTMEVDNLWPPPPSSHFGSWNVLVTNPIWDGCDLGPTIHLSLFHPLNALSLNP